MIGTIVAGLFGAGLVLRWYAVVGSWEYGLRSFDLLLGMLSAVSLGMLAARLDSPFIGNWQWVIVLLFLYGSMQVFSQAYTGLTLTSNPVLVYTAFSLKCVWFLFVSDQFANKRILYYAYESLRPELEKSV